MEEEIFKQEELSLQDNALPLPIVATPGGAMLETGEFSSPNFRHLRSGWRIDARGNAEFNDITILGNISRIVTFTVSSAGNMSAGDVAMILTDGTVATASMGANTASTSMYRIIGIALESKKSGETIRILREGTYVTSGLTAGSFYGCSEAFSSETTFQNASRNTSQDMKSIVAQTFTPTKTFISSIAFTVQSPLGAGTYNYTRRLYRGTPGSGTLLVQEATSTTLSGGGEFLITWTFGSGTDYQLVTPGETMYFELESAVLGELNSRYQNTDVYSGGNYYIAGVSQPTSDARFIIGEKVGQGVLTTSYVSQIVGVGGEMGIAVSTTNLDLFGLPFQQQ